MWRQIRYRTIRSRIAVCLLLTAGLLCAASAVAGQALETNVSRSNLAAARIIVNCIHESTSNAAGKTTLAQAWKQAAADPRDNIIEFAPSLFDASPVALKLDDPITAYATSSGHDRIDATLAAGSITIDFSGCPDVGVIVSSEGELTLIGVTITGGRQRAILVKDSGRLHLQRVTLRGSSGPGVALFDAGQVHLHDCLVTNNRTHGLELHGKSFAKLIQTTLLANGQSGLATFDTARAQCRHCRLSGNGDWNLISTGASQVSVQNSELTQGRFANVDVSGLALLELTDCILEQGERFGIFATGQAKVMLSGTQVRRNAGRGIELQNRTRLHLDRCRVEFSGDYGVLGFGQSDVRATQSVFTHNGAHGVSLRDSSSGRFSECAFLGNRYSGVGCLDDADGSKVEITQCVFQQNGLRPIYRGPLHIDPLVPTPIRIEGAIVECLAPSNARIELFLDRVGEASHYLKTVQADSRGFFKVDCQEVPDGWVMTATATANCATSEFNVIAAPTSGAILAALLAQTGPLSDSGGAIRLDSRLRRWANGTHLVFQIENSPSLAVQRYVQFMVRCIGAWTHHEIAADAAGETLTGLHQIPANAVVVPARYLPAGAERLSDHGGVTFMKWDTDGRFVRPMEIMLATADDPRESCPRVLMHEIGHTLGLCHVRVGLLSRMQGSTAPDRTYLNDFSPTFTFYDVQALHMLYNRDNRPAMTLAQLADWHRLPLAPTTEMARAAELPATPLFSPASPQTKRD